MAKLTKESLLGQIFGYLTITDYLGRDKNGSYKVMARCICGVEKEHFLTNLRNRKHSVSCGCKKSESISKGVTTHGISIRHPLHMLWSAIKRRCNNKADKKYNVYGGAGVTICEQWRNDFKAFYDWAMANGWRKGLQIDKDKVPKQLGIPALIYSPEMCSLLTCKENNNNRKDNIIVEYKGDTLTLSDLADKYNIRYRLLWERYIKRKWDLERAITTPLKK